MHLAGADSGEAARFPVIVRGGVLKDGRRVRYVLNYAAAPGHYAVGAAARDLLSGRGYAAGAAVDLAPWGVAILAETGG